MNVSWLAILSLLALACAQQPENNWAYQDQEPSENDVGNPAQGSGRGEQEQGTGPFLYVTYTQSGSRETNASAAEVAQLETFVRSRGDDTELVTKGSTQLEDGPVLTDKLPKSERIGTATSKGLALETDVNFYPQHAIGVLENGCTAFMISPKHALTSAECVLDAAGAWKERLDMWRGKLGSGSIQHMRWSHVTIPHSFKFYSERSTRPSWALITFHDHSKSPVWLMIGSTTSYSDLSLVLYGYGADNVMYTSKCVSSQQSGELAEPTGISVNCEADSTFLGAPLFIRNSESDRYNEKSTPALLLSSSTASAMQFHRDLFWTLCYIMQQEGEDVGCGKSA